MAADLFDDIPALVEPEQLDGAAVVIYGNNQIIYNNPNDGRYHKYPIQNHNDDPNALWVHRHIMFFNEQYLDEFIGRLSSGDRAIPGLWLPENGVIQSKYVRVLNPHPEHVGQYYEIKYVSAEK